MSRSRNAAMMDATKNQCTRRAAAMPLLAMAGFMALPAIARADTLYFNVDGHNSFNIASNWATDVNGTTTSATVPGPNDTAVIGTTIVQGAPTIDLDANQSVNTLQIGNGTTTTGVITLESDSADNTAGGPYSLTIGAGGIIHSNNTSGGDTIKNNIVLGTSQTWTDNVQLNVAGAITGTANLTLTGSTYLAGANAFNGNLVVAGGTLNATAAGLNIAGTGSDTFQGGIFGQQSDLTTSKTFYFTSGLTDWYTNGNSATLTGPIYGPGGIVFHGGGTTPTETLGGTSNNAGLRVSAIGNIVVLLDKTSSSTVHAVDGNLTLDGGGDTVRLTGTGGDQISDTSTVYIYNGTLDLYGHNETIGALAGYYPNQTELVTNSSATAATLTVGGNNGGDRYQGMIADGAGQIALTKIGTGTQVLSGANTYTGNTAVYGGTLTLDFTQGIPPASNIVSSSSTLVLGGGQLLAYASSSTNSQSFGATSIAAGASTLTAQSNGGTMNVSLGAINRATGGTVNFVLPSSGAITTSTTPASSILGGYAVVNGTDWAAVSGGSIVAFSGYTNGFSSGADVEAGGATSSAGAVSINSLRFNTGGAASVNLGGPLTIASGGILESTNVGGNAVIISGSTITTGNGQDLIVNQYNTNASLNINSSVVDAASGSTGFTKSGSGTVSLGGTNTYTGATNINAGTLTVANNATLGNNSAVILRGGSTLNFTNLGGQINLPSIGATATASSNTQPAKNAIDGDTGTRWESAQSDPQWIKVDLKGNYNLASASISFETAGAKDFVLQVGSSAATGDPDGTSTNGYTTVDTVTGQASYTDAHFITYNFNAPTTGQYFDLYGTARNTGYGYSIFEINLYTVASAITQTIGSLQSTDSTTSVVTPGSFTLNTGSDNTSTTFAGTISGAGSIVKAGSGTFAVTGPNTYTGGTTISAGSLAVNNITGSATGTGSVLVANGAYLSGGNGAADGGSISNGHYAGSSKGVISGAVEVASGGHLSSGNSGVGTLTVGGLTLDSGSVVDVEFNGSANDFIVVTNSGGLTVNGGSFNVYSEGTTSAYTTNGTYHLVDYTGTLGGTGLTALSVANLGATAWSFSTTGDGSGGTYLDLTIGTTPEPGSIGLISGVAGCLAMRRRRRTLAATA